MAFFSDKSKKKDTEEFGAIVSITANHKGGLNAGYEYYIKLHGCQDRLVIQSKDFTFELPYQRVITVGKYDIVEDKYKDLIKINFVNSFGFQDSLVFDGYTIDFVETVQRLVNETKQNEKGTIII